MRREGATAVQMQMDKPLCLEELGTGSDEVELVMKPESSLSGIILAEPTGADGQESIIQQQVMVMRQLCTEVILVTSAPRYFLPLVDRSVRIITNLFPGRGGLGGMHSALSLCKHMNCWIVSSSMPFISPPAAKLMLRYKRTRGNEAVIPCVEGIAHPLHAIYDKDCIDAVSMLLGRVSSTMRDLLDLLSVHYVHGKVFEHLGLDTRFIHIV